MNAHTGGAAAILFAKLWFMASGYALYIGLGRLMEPAEFGLFGVLNGIVSLLNMLAIHGTLQAVSRFVAAHPAARAAIRRNAFLLQALFTAALLGAVLAAAGPIAWFLNDPALARLLRLSTAITGFYAFYAINVGYLNGRRAFVRQAALDVTFATLKVAAILLLVHRGFGLEGVVAGFAAAAALVFLVSLAMVGRPEGGAPLPIPRRELATFAGAALLVVLLQNAFLHLDLLLVKRFAGVTVSADEVGLYAAAQSVARVPYYAMMTASLVVFPLIAMTSVGTAEAAARRADTASGAFGMCLAWLAGIVCIAVPHADRLVLVLYPAGYAGAGGFLAWLIPALAGFALVHLGTSMLNASGRPFLAAILLAACLGIQAALCHVLLGLVGAQGAAIGSLAACVLACAATAAALGRICGMRLAPRLPASIVVAAPLAAGVSIAVARLAEPSGIAGTIAILGAGFATYLLLLLLAGVAFGLPARRRRVLLVTKPLEPPFDDGSKVLPRRLLDLLEPGALAVCAGRGTAGEALPEGLETIRVYGRERTGGTRLLQNLRVFAFLLAHRHRFRAIHFFFAPSPLAAACLRFLRRISPGTPFLQTIMSRPRTWDPKILFGDVVTCSSAETLERFAALGVRHELRLVRPGVPLPAGGGRRAQAIAARGLDERDFHVLFAGDVEHGNAAAHLEVLVPALLADARIRVHLSIRTKSRDSAALLDALVGRIPPGLRDRVHTWIDDRRFDELLHLQDAMVLPVDDLFRKVDAPLVVLESMALGKPVFMLDRPPLDEIPPPALRHRLLAPDAAALAAQVLAFVDDPASIPAEALRRRIESEFALERTARTISELHESHAA